MQNIDVAQQLSQAIFIHKRAPRAELIDAWAEVRNDICSDLLPSGSGFDSGTTIDADESTPDKLVFVTAFHPLDDVGQYVEWVHFIVTMTPTIAMGYEVEAQAVVWLDDETVENAECDLYLADYVAEMFAECLSADLPDKYRVMNYLKNKHNRPAK